MPRLPGTKVRTSKPTRCTYQHLDIRRGKVVRAGPVKRKKHCKGK